jgi:gluconolactonase
MLTDLSRSYRYDVQEDGTWENRKTFAYINARAPDGRHISLSHLVISC